MNVIAHTSYKSPIYLKNSVLLKLYSMPLSILS